MPHHPSLQLGNLNHVHPATLTRVSEVATLVGDVRYCGKSGLNADVEFPAAHDPKRTWVPSDIIGSSERETPERRLKMRSVHVFGFANARERGMRMINPAMATTITITTTLGSLKP